jgi:multimeric flavodoxin WrbA
MAKRILAIMGSYRRDGIIAQAVEQACLGAKEAGVKVETIILTDKEIEFCDNCRLCTQSAGESPGECKFKDDMVEIVKKIEAADGYILGSPVNFGTVTAITKRFMERLVCYAYWPHTEPAPKKRKPVTKKAVVVCSSAMPSLMGRLFTSAIKSLSVVARVIGAKVVGSQFIGLVGKLSDKVLDAKTKKQAFKLGKRLAQRL